MTKGENPIMLSQILSAVRKWLSRTDLPAEVLEDREDSLRVIFETENALAELIVSDPDLAPYRHVSFRVMDVRRELEDGPVFCFYDDETSTIDDILRELDRGAAQIRTM